MSQSKTIIPGVDYDNLHEPGFGDLYHRSSSVRSDARTVVPDIYRQVLREIDEERGIGRLGNVHLQDRPIVGVLFSISRFSTGELFPVYLGRNTIGSNVNNDVFLQEITVSPCHAVLLVRKMETNDGGLITTSYITDYDSEFGTMIGDTPLEYEKMECHDHDIISVGRSYKFLFCLFDFNSRQMYTDTEFKQLETVNGTANTQTEKQKQAESSSHYTYMTNVDEETDFYSPSKRQDGDHSTNKTVVL